MVESLPFIGEKISYVSGVSCFCRYWSKTLEKYKVSIKAVITLEV